MVEITIKFTTNIILQGFFQKTMSQNQLQSVTIGAINIMKYLIKARLNLHQKPSFAFSSFQIINYFPSLLLDF